MRLAISKTFISFQFSLADTNMLGGQRVRGEDGGCYRILVNLRLSWLQIYFMVCNYFDLCKVVHTDEQNKHPGQNVCGLRSNNTRDFTHYIVLRADVSNSLIWVITEQKYNKIKCRIKCSTAQLYAWFVSWFIVKASAKNSKNKHWFSFTKSFPHMYSSENRKTHWSALRCLEVSSSRNPYLVK